MAITLLGDLKPYENLIRRGYIDELTAIANVFNDGSSGCILFKDSDAKGTLTKINFFNDFGRVAHRDITSMSDQVSDKITRNERHIFRTYFKTIPVEWQMEAFHTADGMGLDHVYYMIGRRMAKAKYAASVTQAITIAASAIESGGTDSVLDLTSGTPQNFLAADINKGRIKWGDQFNNLRLMVMTSATFFCMVQDQTENKGYDLGSGITLYGGRPGTMGMPFLVIDSPDLMYTGTNNELFHKTLMLTPEAVTVGDSTEGFRALLTPIGGKENIAYKYQSEWSMWNDVKGYQLKAAANPDKNPDDATLSNPASWERWTVEPRNTAGVLVKHLSDLNAVKQVFNVRYVS